MKQVSNGVVYFLSIPNTQFLSTVASLLPFSHWRHMLDQSFLSFDYCLAASVPSCARKMKKSGRCVLLARRLSILHLTVTEEAGNKSASSSNVGFQEQRNSSIWLGLLSPAMVVRCSHNAPRFHYADTCSHLRRTCAPVREFVEAQMKWLWHKQSNFRLWN